MGQSLKPTVSTKEDFIEMFIKWNLSVASSTSWHSIHKVRGWRWNLNRGFSLSGHQRSLPCRLSWHWHWFWRPKNAVGHWSKAQISVEVNNKMKVFIFWAWKGQWVTYENSSQKQGLSKKSHSWRWVCQSLKKHIVYVSSIGWVTCCKIEFTDEKKTAINLIPSGDFNSYVRNEFLYQKAPKLVTKRASGSPQGIASNGILYDIYTQI